MTNQQQMFVRILLADPAFNLTKAAREAGYSAPRQMGQKLLKIDAVRHYLGNEIRKRGERLEFTADEVLQKLRTIINLDLTDLYDDDGYTDMKRVKELPDYLRSCISKVRTVRSYLVDPDTGEKEYFNKVELEWMSKDHALNLAMKHFGLLEPDLKITIVSDELKAKVIVDLLGHVGGQSNVIDAQAVARLAQTNEQPLLSGVT